MRIISATEKPEEKFTLVTLSEDSLPPRVSKQIIAIGIGARKEMTRRKLVLIPRKIVSVAKQHRISRLALNLADFRFPQLKDIPLEALVALIAENLELAHFEFTKLKTAPREGWAQVAEVVVLTEKHNKSLVERGIRRGRIIAEEVNACRELANTPGGDMTPSVLASAAKKAAHGTKVKVTVLGPKELKKLKMGAILGVSRGSEEEPRFIILEYQGGGKGAPIVLAGKGVTFDSGGLNVKPGDSMYEMHMDMSGGAAVIHAVVLAAKLGVKKNVVGLVPAVENMPSGSSYHPGDVLRSMSGKTIEVLNTDAEGRVILADALTYASRYKPRLIVDIATLTGAALVALGQHASAFMTKDPNLIPLFMELGEESGDYVWPLPLWDEYEEYIKGTFGDVSNLPSSGNTRYGGTINGGMFFYQFAKEYPFVHIDIAPRMTTIPSDVLAKGAAGAPVRLLLRLIEKF